MNGLREAIRRLDRLQKGRTFRWGATACVVALGLALFFTLLMKVSGPGGSNVVADASRRIGETQAQGAAWLNQGPLPVIRQAWDTMLVTMSGEGGMLPIALAIGGVALVSVLVIWLGLGLTYLGLLTLANLVAWPLMAMDQTRALGQIVFAIVPLAMSFFVMMEGLRLAFSGNHPVLAVARNVLNEAVRMKVSLVFIVILLLLLALVPGLLNDEQALRYRVQQWLQYGIGLSYVVLAFLTLFLASATVAYEQRDRIIWQTMSKPVAPWQYVLGKWVGVMGLNAVLLTVTSTGVFLFTEYLSHLPAHGEVAYLVPQDGGQGMTEDREILSNQVLVARVGQLPLNYVDAQRALGVSDEELANALEAAVEDRIQALRTNDAQFQGTDAEIAKVRMDVLQEEAAQYFTVPVDTTQVYIFELPEIKRRIEAVQRLIDAEVEQQVREMEGGGPNVKVDESARRDILRTVTQRYINEDRFPTLMLQYQIRAGSNDPSAIYKVFFLANGINLGDSDQLGNPVPRSIALKSSQTVAVPSWCIDVDGRIRLAVGNSAVNSRALNIPPDGLEMMYVAGGYHVNFFQIMAVIWLKLGFIAAIAIALSTFLSFAVSCLVALAILFMAESAGFLEESLTQYTFLDGK
ncbi:MAG: hypothetical protein KDA21_05850, partial [Phycisphaerales bacterium]|nr:hypothetical protein [Phycisphaerales bacterium]